MEIIKRDGESVPFDEGKIRSAVLKALVASGLPSESVADKVTKDVLVALGNVEVVTVEKVQDLVEEALMKRGLNGVAKAYILYRDEHARLRRQLKVRKVKGSKQSVTDKSMLIVQSMTDSTVSAWDRAKIARHLITQTGMSEKEANLIAKDVENRVFATGLETVNSEFVRELVNSVLMDKGYNGQLQDLTAYKVPKDYIDGLLEAKITENSNVVSNNPEAVSLAITDLVLKQYALDNVFSPDVKGAHDKAMIYLHDLGYPTRVYCSSHSIEYIKKYGLKGLNNLNTTSNPAKSASVLTGHLNTFLASMQSNYAGALGLGYVNIFYAPLLKGMSAKEMRQVAQELIFNGSQNAFSRGGQTLFLDFNIHTGVPSYLEKVPAIHAGGKYRMQRFAESADGQVGNVKGVASVEDDLIEGTLDNGSWCLKWHDPDENKDVVVLMEHNGKQEFVDQGYGHILTYGDYKQEAMDFAHALLDVWYDGDARGRVFEFPKCDFHVSAETFRDPNEYEVFDHACHLAAHNGSTYFVFDRDSVSLASCCRLRVQITDMSLLLHPERLRTCGFQNVTINIPQAAYRAARAGHKELNATLDEIDKAMDLAVKAHLQKKEFIERMMKKGGPLWQLGKEACDGRPYLELKDCTYIIGLIGVNDAVQFLTGKQMHESEEAMDMALKIAGHMYLKTKEYTKQYGITFKLEESPAESAARKIAKSDLVYFRDEALQVYKGGDEDHAYYTNSIHLSADAPVGLLERIDAQAKFNSIIEAGAIIHAFIGEQQPQPRAIAEIIREAFLRTQSAQIVFSPEFTYCETCGKTMNGLHTECSECGSKDVVGETRIVGYFSKVSGWNLSKLAELRARERGKYQVEQN